MLPVSPGSDSGSHSGSLVFDDSISSDGLPSPDEPVRLQLAARAQMPYDGAKGIASAGLGLHSPAPLFVGTPFTSGPTPLFEYPFPAPSTRPSLSNASSLSSVSSLMGPPSPSTRTKLCPYVRLAGRSSNQPIPRRFSGGNNPPPIRVPPRLRTDSTSSVGSSLIDEPSTTVTRTTPVSAPGPSSKAAGNSPPFPVRSSPLQRLRDRSGSVGIHPIQLPPPILTSVPTIGQTNNSTEALLSPTLVLESMTLSGLGSALRMTSVSDEGTRPDLDRRRASIPALFASGERHEDTQEEVEMETPTSYTREKERDSEGDAGYLGIMSINSTT